MKSTLIRFLVGILLASLASHAQDSHYSPNDQQIPVPDCLSVKDLWLSGVKFCTQADHDSWLADIRHWRD